MRYIVFQHLDIEHPGYFRDLWNSQGISWETVSFEQGHFPPDSFDQFDAMIVMGGPMDVWEIDKYAWLTPELVAIRHFVQSGKPFLGLCLGHQLLAKAMGGEVAPAAIPEVGLYEVLLTNQNNLLHGLSSPLTVFQWHSSEVVRLPPASLSLATSRACSIQAFQYGESAFGLQFHAEITEHTVSDWASIPAYKDALEQVLGPEGVSQLQAETERAIPALRATAAVINNNFQALVNHRLR